MLRIFIDRSSSSFISNCGLLQSRLSPVIARYLHNSFARTTSRDNQDDDTPHLIYKGKIPLEHFTVKYAKSSGPGGQNVNKVNTKVDLRFHIASAEWLSEHVRQKILQREKNRINKEG
ncbi:large ribosomal subunit protein mL62-like isoform X2 [Montipora capricornis]